MTKSHPCASSSCPISAFYFPNFSFSPPLSAFQSVCPPSSVLRPLFSRLFCACSDLSTSPFLVVRFSELPPPALRPPPSVLRPPSSVLCPPSSALRFQHFSMSAFQLLLGSFQLSPEQISAFACLSFNFSCRRLSNLSIQSSTLGSLFSVFSVFSGPPT